MGDFDARRNHWLHVAAVAIDGLKRSCDFLRARRRGRPAEALDHRPPEVIFGHAERAAKVNAIHGMHGNQYIAEAHAAPGRILVHLHVLVLRQADQMRDRFANVRHRQRHARPRLDQAENDRIGDGLAFLLHINGDDGRRRRLRRGDS